MLPIETSSHRSFLEQDPLAGLKKPSTGMVSVDGSFLGGTLAKRKKHYTEAFRRLAQLKNT